MGNSRRVLGGEGGEEGGQSHLPSGRVLLVFFVFFCFVFLTLTLVKVLVDGAVNTILETLQNNDAQWLSLCSPEWNDVRRPCVSSQTPWLNIPIMRTGGIGVKWPEHFRKSFTLFQQSASFHSFCMACFFCSSRGNWLLFVVVEPQTLKRSTEESRPSKGSTLKTLKLWGIHPSIFPSIHPPVDELIFVQHKLHLSMKAVSKCFVKSSVKNN